MQRNQLTMRALRRGFASGVWLLLVGAAGLVGCAAVAVQPAQVVPDVPPTRLVTTGVGQIAVRQVGEGKQTLVLWPSILSDYTIYAHQIKFWRTKYKLVLIDGPGHGASGPPTSPFSMRDCATALAQVLDALGETRPVVVVGTSWGGLVAGEFALAYPARTAGIAMLNTPVLKTETSPTFADSFVVWGARWIHGLGLYSDGVARAFFSPATRAAGGPVLERFRAHLQSADGPALAMAVRAVLIDREPLAPRMAAISAPTLVVAGSADEMYPISALRQAAAQLPRGSFVEVPSTHISVVDAPEATLAVVDKFLNELPR
jgi:3-oxoadipate enol-lactonase